MNEEMVMTDAGQSLTKGFEKCRLTAYCDTPGNPAAKWTIAYGSLIMPNGEPVKDGDTITQEEADTLFLKAIASKYIQVTKRITKQLLPQEFDALVDFVYNAGTGYHDHQGQYHDFELWTNVNNGMSGDDLFSYWTTLAITQGGVRLNGLIRRRKAQVTLFQTGEVNFFE